MNLTQSEELIRKKILTILGSDKQLISMGQVRLYTSTKETEISEENVTQNPDEWLYSNLEGNLCYVLDFSKKTRYLRLYENTTFQLLFNMEIYQNFSNFYTAVDPLFHCFEVKNFFIGLQFLELNSANNFQLMIKKLNDQIVQMMLESGSMKVKESRKERKRKFYESCGLLKKNFGAESKYTRDYCEDCMEICKPVFYELLNFMSYNRETKEFEVGSVPKEFRKIFKNMGIKKHMLKKADTTLNFFKYFIESLDKIEDVRKRKMSSYSFEDDEEAEKDEFGDAYLSSEQSNYTGNDYCSTMNSENKSVLSFYSQGGETQSGKVENAINGKGELEKNNTQMNLIKTPNGDSKGNIPKAPPMPGKGVIPPAPKLNLSQAKIPQENKEEPKHDENVKKEEKNKNAVETKPVVNLPKKPMNFLEEITKGVVLKKIDPPKEEKKNTPVANTNQTNCLLSAIKMRGYQLNKNNVDQNSESSDSEWSD